MMLVWFALFYLFAQEFVNAEFDCQNGVVISDSLVCDHLNDCGIDECNCEHTFKCSENECISTRFVCDGHRMCGNGMDECNCSLPTFTCSGRCFPETWVCDGYRNCIDGEDELNCGNQTFVCPEGKTIPDSFRCDGVRDCELGEDECNCATNFQCSANECVSPKQVCDGVPDCLNQKDELNCYCEKFRCSEDESVCANKVCDGFLDCPNNLDECGCDGSFKCDNGTCLVPRMVCDGHIDCLNGEDECACADTFNCGNGSCISSRYLCDGFYDCLNGLDECECGFDVFRCDTGKQCIPNSFKCDDIVDCTDGSDECHCGEKGSFMCTSENKCIPSSFACDSFKDCLLGEDECECGSATFRCNETECVPSTKECDGKIDCGNAKDETECPKFNCSKTEHINVQLFCNGEYDCSNSADEVYYDVAGEVPHGVKCSGLTQQFNCYLDNAYLCDGITHCKTGIDECFCDNTTISGYVSEDCFKCVDESTYIVKSKVCDGVINCNDMSDECLCENPIQVCTQRKDDGIICDPVAPSDQVATTCNGVVECDNGLDEAHCEFHPSTGFRFPYDDEVNQRLLCCNMLSGCSNLVKDFNCSHLYRCVKGESGSTKSPVYAIENDNIPTCGYGDDESFKYSSVSSKCEQSNWMILCDGVEDCRHGYDETPSLCPRRFYCNQTKVGLVSVSMDQLCDGVVDCEDQSDERNCSESTHFYCNESLKSSTMFVLREKVCDKRSDCADGSDECQQCTSSPFSSDKDLISVFATNVFIWFSGILSVFGNVMQIVREGAVLIRHSKVLSSERFVGRVHMMSLAVSDLCVGVYLVILIIKHHQFSGRYCLIDREWRGSLQCSAIGVLSFVGSEMSIVNLLIISVYRLNNITRGLSAAHTHKKTAVGIILLAWCVVILVSIIPILRATEDTFISEVQYNANIFVTLVNKTENSRILDEIKRITHVDTSATGKTYTWQSIFTGMKKIYPRITPSLKMGFYSSHGVCLSNLFPRQTDPSFIFALSIITLNLLCFIAIVLNYLIIYRYSHNVQQQLRTYKTKNSLTRLQKRITLIAVTDCLCWVPLCLIAYAGAAGVEISNHLYAVAAVVLIPINSVLNPFIYSNLPNYIIDNVKKICKHGHWSENRQTVLTNSTENTMRIQTNAL